MIEPWIYARIAETASRVPSPEKTWDEIIAEREPVAIDPLLPSARRSGGQHVHR